MCRCSACAGACAGACASAHVHWDVGSDSSLRLVVQGESVFKSFSRVQPRLSMLTMI